jgi:hypothetical protein
MAAHNVPDETQQMLLLLSHEKTLRYAQAQIAEGELIAGKAIVDGVARQLSKNDPV